MVAPTTTPPARRARATRGVLVVIVVAMVAMWGYVVYLAFGPGRQDPPDRLDDPSFAPAAQIRCDAALDAVAALPRAGEVRTPAERADVVEAANQVFAAMLVDLEALAPDGEDGRIVRAWLGDWRTYLGDREAYAAAVRDDPEARLYVSARDHEQVTEYVEAFAADNHMPACAPPNDV
jgi:hypothetical protein